MIVHLLSPVGTSVSTSVAFIPEAVTANPVRGRKKHLTVRRLIGPRCGFNLPCYRLFRPVHFLVHSNHSPWECHREGEFRPASCTSRLARPSQQHVLSAMYRTRLLYKNVHNDLSVAPGLWDARAPPHNKHW